MADALRARTAQERAVGFEGVEGDVKAAQTPA